MSGKNQWVVRNGNKWGIRGEGNDRLTSVHDTQKAAFERAREIARNQGSEVFVQDERGRIRERNTYDKDPFPPRG